MCFFRTEQKSRRGGGRTEADDTYRRKLVVWIYLARRRIISLNTQGQSTPKSFLGKERAKCETKLLFQNLKIAHVSRTRRRRGRGGTGERSHFPSVPLAMSGRGRNIKSCMNSLAERREKKLSIPPRSAGERDGKHKKGGRKSFAAQGGRERER